MPETRPAGAMHWNELREIVDHGLPSQQDLVYVRQSPAHDRKPLYALFERYIAEHPNHGLQRRTGTYEYINSAQDVLADWVYCIERFISAQHKLQMREAIRQERLRFQQKKKGGTNARVGR